MDKKFSVKKIGLTCLAVGVLVLILGIILLIATDVSFSFGLIIFSVILNVAGINLLIMSKK